MRSFLAIYMHLIHRYRGPPSPTGEGFRKKGQRTKKFSALLSIYACYFNLKCLLKYGLQGKIFREISPRVRAFLIFEAF
jgi:hypothetical protein